MFASGVTVVAPVRCDPIAGWLDALSAGRESDALAILADIYRHRRPTQAEIIFSGACAFACQHCIYPEDYSDHNRGGDPAVLSRSLTALNVEWDVDTFVYSGRTVTAAGMRFLVGLRRALPDARIGLIDNGISIRPHQYDLVDADLDWIDISLDGTQEDHDRQRGRIGSFDAAVEGLEALMRQKLAPRISVLSCLTTINRRSIPDMILDMNIRGIKNFFVTPVVVVHGVRPGEDLALSAEAFRGFVNDISNLTTRLDDAYVEISIYSAWHFATLIGKSVDAHSSYGLAGDHLELRNDIGNSVFCIRYFPTSLAGAREFVVNTSGDVIAPMSMAYGKVPADRIFGNVVRDDLRGIWNRISDVGMLQFYGKELRRERELLASGYSLIDWR